MANYATLKAAIQQVIKTNGNNEITGAILQSSLLSMINSLGADYQFAGVAITSTDPGTPDQNVIYIASQVGTYSNFNNLVVDKGEIAIFKWNGSWAKQSLPITTTLDDDVVELKTRVGYISYNDNLVVGQTVNLIENVNLNQGDKIYIKSVNFSGSSTPNIQLWDDTGSVQTQLQSFVGNEITLPRNTTYLKIYVYGGHITVGGTLSVVILANNSKELEQLPIMEQSVSNAADKVVSSVGIKNAIRDENLQRQTLNSGYIDSNGAVVSNSHFGYYTLPVVEDAELRCYCAVNSIDNSVCLAFFDEDENFLASYHLNDYYLQEHTFIAPSASRIVKVSYRVSLSSDLYAYVNNIPYIIEAVEQIEEIKGQIFEQYSPKNYSSLSFYSHSIASGGMVEEITNTSIKYTRSTPKGNDEEKVLLSGLRAGVTYHLSADANNFVSNDSYFEVFDANTNTAIVRCNPVNNKISADFLVSNPNATLFRIYIRYSEPAELSFTNISITISGETGGDIFNRTKIKQLGAVFNNDYADSQGLYDGVDPTTFGGEDMRVFKRGLCIGDSLVAGTFNYNTSQGSGTAIVDTTRSYPQFLAKMLGITIDVVATGGYTTVDWWSAYGENDYSGYDFVIIQLGVNDIFRYGSFGSESIAAMTNIINKFLGYTGMKVFVTTGFPFSTYAPNMLKFQTPLKTIVESIDNENAILIDTFKYSHVFNDVAYNNVHGTAYGYWKIASELKNYISWYINNNKSQFRAVQFINTNYVL